MCVCVCGHVGMRIHYPHFKTRCVSCTRVSQLSFQSMLLGKGVALDMPSHAAAFMLVTCPVQHGRLRTHILSS